MEFLNQIIHPYWLAIYLYLCVLFSLILWVLNAAWHLRKMHPLPHRWKIQTALFVIILASSIGILYPQPDIHHPQLPLFEPLYVSDIQPLIIEFNRPIHPEIQATISDQISGQWHLHGFRYSPWLPHQLIFVPHQSLPPQTEITITIEHIKPLLGLRQPQQQLFHFQTPPLPKLIASIPAQSQTQVKPNQPLLLTFDQSDFRHVDIQFSLKPRVEMQIQYTDNPYQISLQPLQSLQQQTTYQLSILQSPRVYNYQTAQTGPHLSTDKMESLIKFRTTESPVIQSINLQGSSVLPHETLQITFKHPMQRESVESGFSLEPPVPGTFTWIDDQTLSFIPLELLQLDTTYTLTLDTRVQTQFQGYLEEPYIHHFTTIGSVQIIQTTPTDTLTNVDISTPISITFDQPIEPQTVESRFNISPTVAGEFQWQDQKLTYTPQTSFAHDTTYTVTLTPGITALHGRNSDQTFAFSFTTLPGTFRNAIPLYKQNYSFSCFAAASQMVLAYRGISPPSEVQLMDQIGYQSTPRNFVTNTWGDPNLGVVGTIDGSGPGGYGAHWQPVSNMISQYRSTEIKRNWNLPELLDQVSQGHPVMVWWVNGIWPAKDVSWNTPNGKVYTVNGMHVEVVTGWVGSKENPQYILTNDPYRGMRRYTPQTFHNLWSWFSNTAVVVY